MLIEQLNIVHFGVSIIKLSPASEEDVAWCFFFAPASEKSLQSHSFVLLPYKLLKRFKKHLELFRYHHQVRPEVEAYF